MFRTGSFVAHHVADTDTEQVQPNGVDLRLGAIERFVGEGHIGRDGKRIGEREPVAATDGAFRLDPGAYAAVFAERVRIPMEHVGLVTPRSSLMRNGAMLNTALWDAGYEGRGEALLQVHQPIVIDRDARVAQIVLARADDGGTYDGAYQRERTEE